MVRACNALIAYRTNPHLDQKERGIEAARLMARTLRGEVRPTMAAAFPPLAVNIERQATGASPCRELYRASDASGLAGVLTSSILLGFPYADVAEMGSAVVVVTDANAVVAQMFATQLAALWWGGRQKFRGQLIAVEDAVACAAKLDGPVCLLDMGDNVGGGSPGSSTVLLHALNRAGIAPAFVCVCDPTASYEVEALFHVGQKMRLRVGGDIKDPRLGEPFEADFWVRGTFDGRFEEPQPRHGGITHFDQGPTRVLETDGGLTVMTTDKRMVPFSLCQLTTFGIDPTKFRVLVAKGVHAPVAAYAPVCKHLVRVDTPGVTSADLSRLEYRNRRRPMYPFEPDTQWEPTEITMGHTVPLAV
jgi:microcystin degradation protein MlrC